MTAAGAQAVLHLFVCFGRRRRSAAELLSAAAVVHAAVVESPAPVSGEQVVTPISGVAAAVPLVDRVHLPDLAVERPFLLEPTAPRAPGLVEVRVGAAPADGISAGGWLRIPPVRHRARCITRLAPAAHFLAGTLDGALNRGYRLRGQ